MPEQSLRDPLPVINEGERHISIVLLVDTSGSMSGEPISELNRGLIEFGNAIKKDPFVLARTEVCIMSINSKVRTEVGFRPAEYYEAPVLSAHGVTVFNEAVQAGLDAIQERRTIYNKQGVSFYRPWLFVLTDGLQTDTIMETAAKNRLWEAIRNTEVTFMPMGIGYEVNISKLQEYYPPEVPAKYVLKAGSNNFMDVFAWISESIAVIVKSDPSCSGEVNLPDTPNGITFCV